MLKVAHVVTAYSSVVTILDSKLRILDKCDDLDMVAISSPPDVVDQRHPAVKHIPVKMARTIRPLADLKSIWSLYKVCKRERFDIVHSHTAKAGFITAVAAKLAGVLLICHTYHGLPFYQGQDKVAYHLYRFFEKIACRFRDYVFTQNKRDLHECIDLIGDKHRVLFEGNGVDVEFVTESANRWLSRALDDYPLEGFKLVLLSRLEPIKRVDDFFGVVQKLKLDGMKISAVVAGEGILEKQLKRRLLEMHLDGCVRMVGFSDYPHALIAAGDVVVLCSEKEGIPRSIMEAMALAKPVVATDVPGTQELVIDGVTGFLTKLGDQDAMAEKIKVLANDKELRFKMGQAGRQRVQKYYNDTKIAEFLHRFYTKAVREKQIGFERTTGRGRTYNLS